MSHEHEVTSLVPLVMEGHVVNVAQHCPGTQTVRVVPHIDVLTEAVHFSQAGVIRGGQLTLGKAEEI